MYLTSYLLTYQSTYLYTYLPTCLSGSALNPKPQNPTPELQSFSSHVEGS